MPYTESQNKLFRAAAHNPAIAKKHGMSKEEASKMASEGVKKKPTNALIVVIKGKK